MKIGLIQGESMKQGMEMLGEIVEDWSGKLREEKSKEKSEEENKKVEEIESMSKAGTEKNLK